MGQFDPLIPRRGSFIENQIEVSCKSQKIPNNDKSPGARTGEHRSELFNLFGIEIPLRGNIFFPRE